MSVSSSLGVNPVRSRTQAVCSGSVSSPSRVRLGFQRVTNRLHIPQLPSNRTQPSRAGAFMVGSSGPLVPLGDAAPLPARTVLWHVVEAGPNPAPGLRAVDL